MSDQRDRFTPGPWEANQPLYGADSGRWLVGDGHDLVASVVGRNRAEQEANAQLIAAAPDLLAENKRLTEQRDALLVMLREARAEVTDRIAELERVVAEQQSPPASGTTEPKASNEAKRHEFSAQTAATDDSERYPEVADFLDAAGPGWLLSAIDDRDFSVFQARAEIGDQRQTCYGRSLAEACRKWLDHHRRAALAAKEARDG